MSDEDLVAHYNNLAMSTVVGTSFYREEIAHRQLARQNARMLSLTRTMARLTWFILFLTAANAAIVFFPLLKA
ncbi:hypothetical protein FQK01_18450 [Xanthomonas vasicola]|uniref:Uncharacterized protein n=2 Tax=Xanthomonas vasicola TaxID=56459 RepID=A0ABD7S7Q2_XANVA|nr:hypothetical protein FQK01_18450 [Xanthomonas vasicola]